jgi:predicted Rossmann fold nucleotide-binding protein DprA/Smf involved in DNA uptake
MMRLLERGGQLALELERLSARGIWALSRADDEYPRRWKARLKATAPVVLFGAGPLSSLEARAMAIVGSREVDEAALAFTSRLATACVRADLAIVSGGARGSDAAAVSGALEGGGRAIIVLAESLEQTLKKREVLAAIRAGRLAVVTAEHPSRPFSIPVAMGRNRLIYCLAEWATVVSSTAGTGGTWNGAVEALRSDWVPVFVRDEESTPEGNRRLLERGAMPIGPDAIDSADSLLHWLNEAHALKDHGRLVARETASEELPGTENAESEPAFQASALSHAGAVDAYNLLIERILEYCSEPRTLEDVAAAFVLERAQAKAWLGRALGESRLRKRTKPVRFERVSVPSLFGEP